MGEGARDGGNYGAIYLFEELRTRRRPAQLGSILTAKSTVPLPLEELEEVEESVTMVGVRFVARMRLP